MKQILSNDDNYTCYTVNIAMALLSLLVVDLVDSQRPFACKLLATQSPCRGA